MQGSEVTTHLKSLPELLHTQIIALTGESQQNIKEMLLTAGCDGYIPKPINVSEFIFKIESFLSGYKEEIEPEKEKQYLQRYNIQLVDRLKKKLSEFENLNNDLARLNKEILLSKEEMASYNNRLFYLNNLANYLRLLENPDALINILPSKAIEGFGIKRCILFEYEKNQNTLTPVVTAGVTSAALSKKKLKLNESFFHYLSVQGGILWIKDLTEIADPSLSKFASKLKSENFILGNLSSLGIQKETTKIFHQVKTDMATGERIKPSRKLIIFLDKGEDVETFKTYEVRIIKSFLHSVAIIYENMVLHTRLIELYKIKSEQAIRDGMTKIYNHRYFVQELEREGARSKRYKTIFSLMMIDVDNFKEFNDAQGHLGGDTALIALSEILDKNTRTTDTVARYGGEEFAIILPGLKKEAAITIAEKLRVLIEGHDFLSNKSASCCKITISIGVSSFPEDTDLPDNLLRLADSALYSSKKAGRNRVSF